MNNVRHYEKEAVYAQTHTTHTTHTHTHTRLFYFFLFLFFFFLKKKTSFTLAAGTSQLVFRQRQAPQSRSLAARIGGHSHSLIAMFLQEGRLGLCIAVSSGCVFVVWRVQSRSGQSPSREGYRSQDGAKCEFLFLFLSFFFLFFWVVVVVVVFKRKSLTGGTYFNKAKLSQHRLKNSYLNRSSSETT